MPDYKLQAPESEATGDGDVYVTGDPAERAQLLARGYTEVDDGARAADTQKARAKPPRSSSPAPGVEIRQPDSAPPSA